MKQGTTAPAFKLPTQTGELVTLDHYKGKWVVIYFYPRDNTPGCTIEAIDFTARKREFDDLNCVILGVSKDSVKSHCNFIEKQNLTITLLSDEEKTMIEAYGAWGQKKFMGREFMGIIRSTVLIDPEGKVAYHWPNVKAKGHAEEVLGKVKELDLV